jgi:pimeloyl-ACP methyl ester carboxylesterase
MRDRTRGGHARLAAFVAALSLAPFPGGADAQAPAVPRFEPAPCPVPTAPGERIDCGALIVAERRGTATSRTIRLPVVIFRSRAEWPAPDPLVFITGGPGGSNVAGRTSGRRNPFLDERDYILLEPRGARHAEPALGCPAVNDLTGEIAAGRLPGEAGSAALVEAARECRQALVTSGIDLDAYTTAASADDLEDLRRALALPAWNLYGLSYGTRVALTLLRRHPDGVRSVVLDSVLPPEVNFDEAASVNLVRALNAVFDGCAVDRDCGRAFPDLRERFAALVARADRTPLPVDLGNAALLGRVTARGAQVVDAVYAALHDPEAIPRIPRLVADAVAGRYEGIATLIAGNQGPSSSAWGLRYSIWCADEAPFHDPQRVAAQVSPALGLGGIDERTVPPGLCAAWNVAPSPAEENTRVRSAVPALVFAGEFDPDTPPQWGRQILEGMPAAFYVEMRGRSHGAAFNACGAEIVAAFLRAPSSPPPVGCALALRGADFGASARE